MIQVMAMYRPWITPALINQLRNAYGSKFYDLSEVESPDQFLTCLRSAAINQRAILVTNSGLARRLLKEEGFEYLLVYPHLNTNLERTPSRNSYINRQVYDSRNEAGAFHQEIRNTAKMIIEFDKQTGWVVEELS